MKDNKKVKDNHIKVRTSLKEREIITSNAQSLGLNTSDYIRHCCLSNNPLTLDTAPTFTATATLLNEIYHLLEEHTDSKTLRVIRKKIKSYYGGVNHYE